MRDQSVIKVNKLFYKLSSLTSLALIIMMNDILTKQALKISLFVDVGEATMSGPDEFLILCFTVFLGGGCIWNRFNNVFN